MMHAPSSRRFDAPRARLGGLQPWQDLGMPLEGMHEQRRRAASFGSVAQAYDRFRSGYPEALIDHLLADHPSSTLDVGCGTGKVAAAVAARGFRVVGVEPDA